MNNSSIILLLGTNIPDRMSHLRHAKELIQLRLGPVNAVSNLYNTQSWGFDSADFLNLVLSVSSAFSPTECLKIIQQIEREMGRVRKISGEDYEDRNIDIDILFYNDEIVNLPELVIPHPRMTQRNFVLFPLNDIVPHFMHPVFNQPVEALLSQCTDNTQIQKIDGQI